jgi:FkbM family methyltransferase
VIYRTKKLYKWFTEFGLRGLWLLLHLEKLDSSSVVTLRSKRIGLLYCRARKEDFEAVNTVICFRAYEADDLRWQNGTVVDLGANIGIATRYFLSVLPSVQVIAIEPSRENKKIFEVNISAVSDGARVKLKKCAVGPKSGSGRLLRDPGGRLDSFRVEFLPSPSRDSDDVEVLALEDVFHGLQYPILLKMDIEGTEDSLLQNRAKWSAGVSRMMIEFHELELERSWVRVLTEEGWRCEKHFDTWHFSRSGCEVDQQLAKVGDDTE